MMSERRPFLVRVVFGVVALIMVAALILTG
jgi:hypothetical protein